MLEPLCLAEFEPADERLQQPKSEMTAKYSSPLQNDPTDLMSLDEVLILKIACSSAPPNTVQGTAEYVSPRHV